MVSNTHVDVVNNPLVMVFDAFWEMLEAHDGFTSLVPAGSRVKFNKAIDRDPSKDQMLPADFPEVRVVPTGLTPHLERTSTSSSVLMKLEIQISTGDRRVQKFLYPVTWAIYRALLGWKDKLAKVEYLGQKLVKLCKPTEVAEGVSNADLNRGIAGWSAIWSGEVELWFVTEKIRPEGVDS